MFKSEDSEVWLRRWHDQIGRRRPYGHCRPFAAMGCVCRGASPQSTLVKLRRVVLVVLFDDPIGRRVPALRLVGYGGQLIDHGIEWGGPANCKFYRDLRIEPTYGGAGLTIDAADGQLLKLALQLRSEIYRLDRFCPQAARPQPQLPRVWAGFAASDAKELRGDGPELETLCSKFDLSAETMLGKFQRKHQGLFCYPVDWVSSELHRSLAVFVDLQGMPRHQVFRLPAIPAGLQGYQAPATIARCPRTLAKSMRRPDRLLESVA